MQRTASESILRDLEEIINATLAEMPLPYQKGNSIRIKNIIIRKSSNGYLIYDSKINKQLARTHFKSSAIALAKNAAIGIDVVKQIKQLDAELLKHYNDSVFYLRTIRNSETTLFVKNIRKTRLGISLDQTKYIRQQIDDFIF